MSLQVWLPLTKDYNNYGLSDLSFSLVNSSYISLPNNGKIGEKAYYNSSYTGGCLVSDKTLLVGNKISIFCWARFSALYGDSSLGGAMGGQHRYPNNTGMGLTFKYISSTTGYLSCNTGNGSSRTYNTYCGGTLLQAETWYHVGMTYDGSTIKLYVNGKLDGSHSYSGQSSPADYVQVGAWSFGDASSNSVYNSYKIHGYLNDFRLYNHVLTLKEIKEISQGLAAHYQLKGFGRTNYVKGVGSYLESSPLVRNLTDTSVPSDSYVYHSGISATIPTDGTYTWILRSNGMPTGHPTGNASGKEGLFSMWLQNTSTGSHYLWGSQGIAPNGDRYGSVTIPAGTYNVRTNLYAANDSYNYTIKLWNIRLVAGGYAEDPWQPNSADAMASFLGTNSLVEADVSGNGNHGTKSALFDVDLDSKRYDTSYVFNGSKYIACGRGGMVKDTITVACWAYCSNWASFNSQLISCTEGGGWGMGYAANVAGSGFEMYSNGSYYGVPFGYTSLSAGWHHFAATYNGNTIVGYVDGVVKATKTGVPSGIIYHASNSIIIGGEAGGGSTSSSHLLNGKISDVRIYGTALSAQDIKELYETSGSVDKDGKAFVYEFTESKGTNIGKNGVLTSDNFSDKSTPTYSMKTKALPDGTQWARIHHLNVEAIKNNWFTTAEVSDVEGKPHKYSKMALVDKYKTSAGNYEFMLTYPSLVKTLPSGYSLLGYIEATGTQYIKTGVTNSAIWQFDIQFTDTTTRQLMGYGGNGAEYWGSQENGMYGLATWSYMNVPSGGRDTVVHDYSGTDSLWVQGQSLGMGHTDVSSKEYQIFAITGSYLCKARLWRCKCIQNGTLIRDFVPAKRNSDNYIGLYDIINGVFYGNSGSGVFKFGGAETASNNIELYNRWLQTSSPNAASQTGVKHIMTSWSAHNAGIRKNGTTSVYNCDSGGTWYAPIGQISTWTDTQFIPAADGSSQTETELWVRTDNIAGSESTFRVYNDSVTAKDFIEV